MRGKDVSEGCLSGGGLGTARNYTVVTGWIDITATLSREKLMNNGCAS